MGASDPGASAAGLASAGLAKSLASVPAFRDAVMHLQAELNRFGPGAPVGLRYVTPALPVDGILTVGAAASAVALLQRRYQDSIEAFPGESTSSLAKLKQVTSATAMLDPIGYVMAPGGAAGVQDTTAMIQKYADSKALPAAAPIAITQILGSLFQPTTLAIGAAALAFFLWSR